MTLEQGPGWRREWREGYLDAVFGDVETRTAPRPPMEWRTGVEDAAGRTREVVVTETDGVITVSPPPGEGFSITTDQADLLALALLSASNCAQKRRVGRAAAPGQGQAGTMAYWRRQRSG
jgi:hypothetical protein